MKRYFATCVIGGYRKRGKFAGLNFHVFHSFRSPQTFFRKYKHLSLIIIIIADLICMSIMQCNLLFIYMSKLQNLSIVCACTVSMGKLFHNLIEFGKKSNLYASILDWGKMNFLS